MDTSNFITELMNNILEGSKIPKVQVERAITPVLSMFIEKILESYFKDNSLYSGKYDLVSQEFPLKKNDNNQSTNIDYLLINKEKKILVLFELKTDDSSLRGEQIERYIELKDAIRKRSAMILKSGLESIADASKKSGKYEEYTLKRFIDNIPNPGEIKNSILFMLIPQSCRNSRMINDNIDFVLSFGELPEDINHKWNDAWKIIRKSLTALDNSCKIEYACNPPIKSEQRIVRTQYKINFNSEAGKRLIMQNESVLRELVPNLHRSLYQTREARTPEFIRLGLLGSGNTPNYQVYFTDGSIKTFTFKGTSHHTEVFKSSNLGLPIKWDDIKQFT